MPTAFIRRYIIVARADVAALANTASQQSDTGNGGGDLTFTVGLSVSGNVPATHYWCSWAMTTAQALAIRTRLQSAGATNAETTPIVHGQTPASTRFAIFDVLTDGWTPDEVLTACGLKVVTGP